MPLLAVNLDPVSCLSRKEGLEGPDPVQMAVLAEMAGADVIAVTLRDEKACMRLRTVVRRRFCLFTAPGHPQIRQAVQMAPDQVILVPSSEEEGPPELAEEEILEAVQTLRKSRVEIGLAMSPQIAQVKQAYQWELDSVLFRTESLVTREKEGKDAALDLLIDSCSMASKLGLRIHLGTDCSPHGPIPVRSLKNVYQVHVGCSVVDQALLLGFERAVSDRAKWVH